LSGRTTIAVAIWLMAWAILHQRWKHRQLEAGRVHAVTLVLVGLGMLFVFPPLWQLF
jgi:hypothetical protein